MVTSSEEFPSYRKFILAKSDKYKLQTTFFSSEYPFFFIFPKLSAPFCNLIPHHFPTKSPSSKSTEDSVAVPSSELLPPASPLPRLDALAAAFLGGEGKVIFTLSPFN
ncbi:hypothetical protein TIFTF001_034257 [Ficus carica]|uniref:Uncharacterized protein n=1 Tax=Ficus carica TaxID=3494 RepID=A0AA88E0U9_FICCA|nr:hypothetical protein TIFTF001_034257 [Ficus carica]